MKPRILIIGDAVAPTGFARVIRGVFEPLVNDYEIHQLATRFEGGNHNYPWRLYPAGAGTNVYGYDLIPGMIERIRPAIIFLIYDLAFQIPYMKILREAAGDARIVIYCPVEAGPVAPEIMEFLHGVSRYVMYTDYGRREIEASLKIVRERNPQFHFPPLDVIPHGIDCQTFHPLEVLDSEEQLVDKPGNEFGVVPARRIRARRALGFCDAEHVEAFIVLNANRNMPRKRIDLTMQGFALFAQGKPPNVKLYLHMATEDTGWNVLTLAKRYGIYDRLIMTQADNSRPQMTDTQLNLLYNACDVGMTTTTGEGWGLISFEHAATKAAQIVPRHTSLADLWDGQAAFVEHVMTLTNTGNLTDAYIVAPEGVAAALEHLYRDEEYRNQLAEAGYRNANRPEFRWDRIALTWTRLFQETIHGVE